MAVEEFLEDYLARWNGHVHRPLIFALWANVHPRPMERTRRQRRAAERGARMGCPGGTALTPWPCGERGDRARAWPSELAGFIQPLHKLFTMSSPQWKVRGRAGGDWARAAGPPLRGI